MNSYGKLLQLPRENQSTRKNEKTTDVTLSTASARWIKLGVSTLRSHGLTAKVMAQSEECHPSPVFCLYIIAGCSSPHTVFHLLSLSPLSTTSCVTPGTLCLPLCMTLLKHALSNWKTTGATDLAVTCHG